ncbi:hypothetical protein [Armatimonas sp.]|uniref:hypothetical protein n=1 Tax=Armatimonas sp. TaxID=1872638 RepID=UPI003751D251
MSGYTRPIKFLLGTVHVTPAAVEALIRNDVELIHLLKRHREGDYGMEMCYYDRVVNEQEIKRGGRILSSYTLTDKTVIWIITAAGWTESTVLIREEY